MRKSLLLCALAYTSILLVGAPGAFAQAPAVPAPKAQDAMPVPAAAPAAAPAAMPAAVTPAPAAAVAPEQAVAAAKPHLSACARAIKATERKLDKSTADAKVIAAAWAHIAEAKKTKGAVCEEHAKQAADML